MVKRNSSRTDAREHEARTIDKTTANVDFQTASSVDERSEGYNYVDPREERAFASQTSMKLTYCFD